MKTSTPRFLIATLLMALALTACQPNAGSQATSLAGTATSTDSSTITSTIILTSTMPVFTGAPPTLSPTEAMPSMTATVVQPGMAQGACGPTLNFTTGVDGQGSSLQGTPTSVVTPGTPSVQATAASPTPLVTVAATGTLSVTNTPSITNTPGVTVTAGSPTALATVSATGTFAPLGTQTAVPGTTGTPAVGATQVSTSAVAGQILPVLSGTHSICVTLVGLLAEHEALLSGATGAQVNGRTLELQAILAALDANTRDLLTVFGATYGMDDGMRFQTIWQRHISELLNYASARAQGSAEAAAADQARADLLQFADDFGALVNTLNPDLTQADITALMEQHVLTGMAIVEAQVANDLITVYTLKRHAQLNTQHIAITLAEGIVQQFPEQLAP